MTGSWTEGELPNTPHAEHIYGGGPNPNVSEYPDEPPADKPRLQRLLEEDPRWAQSGGRIRFATNTNTSDTERREKLRAEELERMDRLYKRIEQGIEEDAVDLESATMMLLNVSRARLALGGIGTYPGAF